MTMSSEANKAVVRRYMQAVVDGDLQTLEALQHPDVRWWVIGFGEMDRAAFLEGAKALLLSAEKRSLTITGMTAEGDRVAFEATGEMVFANGKVYANSYHNLYVVRDGVIVEGREYMDPRAVAAAFG
jgi:ketosteroid isomerase-like protein